MSISDADPARLERALANPVYRSRVENISTEYRSVDEIIKALDAIDEREARSTKGSERPSLARFMT